MHIGIIGYSFAAFLFLLFSTRLLTTWRGRVEGTYLLVASVVSGCWALSAVALEVKYSTFADRHGRPKAEAISPR